MFVVSDLRTRLALAIQEGGALDGILVLCFSFNPHYLRGLLIECGLDEDNMPPVYVVHHRFHHMPFQSGASSDQLVKLTVTQRKHSRMQYRNYIDQQASWLRVMQPRPGTSYQHHIKGIVLSFQESRKIDYILFGWNASNTPALQPGGAPTGAWDSILFHGIPRDYRRYLMDIRTYLVPSLSPDHHGTGLSEFLESLEGRCRSDPTSDATILFVRPHDPTVNRRLSRLFRDAYHNEDRMYHPAVRNWDHTRIHVHVLFANAKLVENRCDVLRVLMDHYTCRLNLSVPKHQEDGLTIQERNFHFQEKVAFRYVPESNNRIRLAWLLLTTWNLTHPSYCVEDNGACRNFETMLIWFPRKDQVVTGPLAARLRGLVQPHHSLRDIEETECPAAL